MSVAHSDFFTSAEQMISGSVEMDYRNAISRSYYAAYHRALESAIHCPDNSHLVMTCGVHERTIDRYLSFSNQSPLCISGKSIAYVLRQLKANRHRADYTLDADVALNEAKTNLAQVKLMLGKFQAFDALAMQSQAPQSLP